MNVRESNIVDQNAGEFEQDDTAVLKKMFMLEHFFSIVAVQGDWHRMADTFQVKKVTGAQAYLSNCGESTMP